MIDQAMLSIVADYGPPCRGARCHRGDDPDHPGWACFVDQKPWPPVRSGGVSPLLRAEWFSWTQIAGRRTGDRSTILIRPPNIDRRSSQFLRLASRVLQTQIMMTPLRAADRAELFAEGRRPEEG